MQFLNKNIAILGLGLESLDFLNWLVATNQSPFITIFDHKDKPELIDQLPQSLNLKLSLGENYLEIGLSNFDLIFRSPGFYLYHPELIKAKEAGVEITSGIKLFLDLCPAKIIGVTGTKGKGTTTTLIHHILLADHKKSFIAGNIGKPVLSLLPHLSPTDYACLELSSFQLQDLTKSPHLAVVLNITSEHLDVHQSTQEYRQAKLNIISHQSDDDIAVINADYPTTKDLGKLTPAKVYQFSRYQPVIGSYVDHKKIILNLHQKKQVLGDTQSLLLRGEHNWENITAAITATASLGATLKAIKKTVYQFKGLEHRLELVAKVNQVKYYNDSFSTTPETAIAALKSFKEPTILILGGSDKGSDYSELGKEIINAHHLKCVILIGQMAPAIRKAIKKAGNFKGKIIYQPSNMIQIIKQAHLIALPGEVVVLSPACASFDMFKNYKDRGLQFKQGVKSLS